ncbi:hypothetical protein ABID22_003638 [Pontibacter aydingkolensis]|uniref:Uncharacterized protein n=1 Tax=Pontibacter aydingkolensis TaxID=1911536 RepID=A0ABS7CYI8_9BACT|nr:hypothetical protein [Pontibacter aydingkolensis]MBW7468909.1 hypothetical protein [Pontibacter aydingkolensis]
MAVYRSDHHHSEPTAKERILTAEQEELLDLYLQKLDTFFEELKEAEKTEVAIETLHLKRILSGKKE